MLDHRWILILSSYASCGSLQHRPSYLLHYNRESFRINPMCLPSRFASALLSPAPLTSDADYLASIRPSANDWRLIRRGLQRLLVDGSFVFRKQFRHRRRTLAPSTLDFFSLRRLSTRRRQIEEAPHPPVTNISNRNWGALPTSACSARLVGLQPLVRQFSVIPQRLSVTAALLPSLETKYQMKLVVSAGVTGSKAKFYVEPPRHSLSFTTKLQITESFSSVIYRASRCRLPSNCRIETLVIIITIKNYNLVWPLLVLNFEFLNRSGGGAANYGLNKRYTRTTRPAFSFDVFRQRQQQLSHKIFFFNSKLF